MSGLILTFVMSSTTNLKLEVYLLLVLVSHTGWVKLKESSTKRRWLLLEPGRERTLINSTKNRDGKAFLKEDGFVCSSNSLKSIQNNLTPEYLKSPVPSPRPQLIATRSGIEHPHTNAKRDYYKNSFYPDAITSWNNFDPTLRTTTSLSSFK